MVVHDAGPSVSWDPTPPAPPAGRQDPRRTPPTGAESPPKGSGALLGGSRGSRGLSAWWGGSVVTGGVLVLSGMGRPEPAPEARGHGGSWGGVLRRPGSGAVGGGGVRGRGRWWPRGRRGRGQDRLPPVPLPQGDAHHGQRHHHRQHEPDGRHRACRRRHGRRGGHRRYRGPSSRCRVATSALAVASGRGGHPAPHSEALVGAGRRALVGHRTAGAEGEGAPAVRRCPTAAAVLEHRGRSSPDTPPAGATSPIGPPPVLLGEVDLAELVDADGRVRAFRTAAGGDPLLGCSGFDGEGHRAGRSRSDGARGRTSYGQSPGVHSVPLGAGNSAGRSVKWGRDFPAVLHRRLSPARRQSPGYLPERRCSQLGGRRPGPQHAPHRAGHP